METYDIRRYGLVRAIRIFLAEDDYGCNPMAELVFDFGEIKNIPWDDAFIRKKYIPGITGYTYIYDERPKREFEDWAKIAEESV